MDFGENYRGVPLAIMASGLFAFWCIPTDAYVRDLEFWQEWTQAFVDGGFGTLHANYPPVYLEWLWVVGRAYKAFGQVPETDWLFKTWVALPVVFVQMLVLDLVARTLAERGRKALNSPVFWLTAFNPALLLDGPVWGQVDILPMAFVGLGLYLYQKDARHAFWLPALGLLAVLTKFQAIVFLPLMGALALKHPKRLAMGLWPAVGIGGLVLAPFWSADVLGPTLARAYVDNLDLYPYATYNAANLWHLLGQNTAPDDLVIFTWQEAKGGFAGLFTSRVLGIMFFGVAASWIFFRTLKARSPAIYPSALVLAVVFFVFASGMHERYLVPAVVVGSLAAARQDRYWLPYLAITVLAFLNIQLVRPVSGVRFWTLLASATVLLPAWISFLANRNRAWMAGMRRLAAPPLQGLVELTHRHSRLIYAAFALVLLLQPWLEMRARHQDIASRDPGREIMLSTLTPAYADQAWGRLRRDKSVAGGTLRVAGRGYAQGLGTHARSAIGYRIPRGAVRFHARVGMDDEAPNGRARFSVQVDGKTVWTSKTMTTGMRPEAVTVALESRDQILVLGVDPLGRRQDDHADWINARFELEQVPAPPSGQSGRPAN